MSDTPERIWACIAHDGRLLGITQWPVEFWSEYTRTDLIQTMLDAAEQLGYANAMEAERKLHEDRIEELEAKLAAAVDGLTTLSYIHDGNPSDARADTPPLDYARHMLWEARSIARTTLAELTGGQKDE